MAWPACHRSQLIRLIPRRASRLGPRFTRVYARWPTHDPHVWPAYMTCIRGHTICIRICNGSRTSGSTNAQLQVTWRCSERAAAGSYTNTNYNQSLITAHVHRALGLRMHASTLSGHPGVRPRGREGGFFPPCESCIRAVLLCIMFSNTCGSCIGAAAATGVLRTLYREPWSDWSAVGIYPRFLHLISLESY
eukprot:3862170-Pyramimonas_sp.AAC.1